MAIKLNFCISSIQKNKLIGTSQRCASILNKNKKKSTVLMNEFSSKNNTFVLTKNEKIKTFFPILIGLSFFLNPTNSYGISDEKPQTKIVDESGTLTKSSISYIEKSISKLKENNEGDVFFVVVRNLPFEKTAQEYAQELFQKWNLGNKDVVVVLSTKIAKGGIFFGDQVQTLSDKTVKSIGEETYTFKAKEEQYSSAALDVNNRLVSILSNKGDPGPPIINRGDSSSNFKSAKNTEEQRSKYIAIIVILLVIAFVVPMFQFFFYVKDE
ncbi:hypothetical protein CMESO_411 (nucleomorph) [Chroomonas mesostigmatica CCMP1168]|uniref:TPM domain-containing protein n=1 Tax=Chroomonas mesostigmatica CCMP1168 TaxID=1195612 RepID=J7G3E0_9CRYP|nr:hypothetical protein CMESO_411 [Chroomonas mesostigmatica CCMP1168]|mmetsp:Transcript_65893/g.162208  ORF Transcript_65893/g.162208 Transcript_65893/m.162208 type:complete len:269 (-) Transcript_65893:543-1349(-)